MDRKQEEQNQKTAVIYKTYFQNLQHPKTVTDYDYQKSWQVLKVKRSFISSKDHFGELGSDIIFQSPKWSLIFLKSQRFDILPDCLQPED